MTPAGAARWAHPQATAAFSPPSIAGLVAWYDASVAASITSSGGAVSQWNDLSGNGFHLTQGTAGRQPATGTRTQNGLNVLDFDGGDALDRATTPTTSAPLTVAYVFKMDSSSPFTRPYDAGSAGNRPLTYISAGGVQWTMQISAAGSTTRAPQTTPVLQVCTFNGASSTFLENNVNYGPTATPGTGAMAGLTLMNDASISSGIDGWMGEFVVYNSALGSTDRDNLTEYFRAKWALF